MVAEIKSGSERVTEAPPTGGESPRKHPFRTGFIVGALVAIAATLLMLQNSDRIEVEWLIFDLRWPLWVILLLSFLAGMVAWQLLVYELGRLRRTVPEDRPGIVENARHTWRRLVRKS